MSTIEEPTTSTYPSPQKPIKAVVLLSGGLDSAIAAKMILDQGIDVYGINFHSPFCLCNSKGTSYECGALFFAQRIGIPIKMVSKGDDFLEVIAKPRYGYGKNINPCIDCRIHILHIAKKYAEEIGAKFLITGEVLGQRPKSQTLKAIQIIEKESGWEGFILHPLSAKLLPPTKVEELGYVDRSKLLQIQGRRRNIQVELGQQYKLIRQYCASGGCLLTDANFAAKLRDYFANTPRMKMDEMKFLKIGRHFRFKGTKIIIGREEQENKFLKSWARSNDVLIEVKNCKGPTTLVESATSQDILEFAAQATLYYADSEDNKVNIAVSDNNARWKDFSITRDDSLDLESYKIHAESKSRMDGAHLDE